MCDTAVKHLPVFIAINYTVYQWRLKVRCVTVFRVLLWEILHLCAFGNIITTYGHLDWDEKFSVVYLQSNEISKNN